MTASTPPMLQRRPSTPCSRTSASTTPRTSSSTCASTAAATRTPREYILNYITSKPYRIYSRVDVKVSKQFLKVQHLGMLGPLRGSSRATSSLAIQEHVPATPGHGIQIRRLRLRDRRARHLLHGLRTSPTSWRTSTSARSSARRRAACASASATAPASACRTAISPSASPPSGSTPPSPSPATPPTAPCPTSPSPTTSSPPLPTPKTRNRLCPRPDRKAIAGEIRLSACRSLGPLWTLRAPDSGCHARARVTTP